MRSPTRRAGACPHVDVSRERPSSDTAIVGVAYRRRLELGRRRAGPSRCPTGCVQARTAARSTGARTVRPRRTGPAGACVARQAPATRALFLDQPGRAGPDRDRRTRGRSRPWTLLAVPGAGLACLACLRSAFKGPRDPFFELMRWAGSASGRTGSKPRSVAVTRMWLAFFAVLLSLGAGLAVAAALPPGPTVDVQVVAVAYGDGLPDSRAELFGLGVRSARCSGGATAYRLAVRGIRLELSCAKTSGTRTRTVIVGLSPGHSYMVTIRAVQDRGGRRARAGTTRRLTVHVPGANSKSWQTN